MQNKVGATMMCLRLDDSDSDGDGDDDGVVTALAVVATTSDGRDDDAMQLSTRLITS